MCVCACVRACVRASVRFLQRKEGVRNSIPKKTYTKVAKHSEGGRYIPEFLRKLTALCSG